MNEHDESLLLIIKEKAEILIDLVDGYDFKWFLSDERTERSVTMTLINIGECVKPLSENLKQTYPDVRWVLSPIYVNIAAHNYWGLHMDWILGKCHSGDS